MTATNSEGRPAANGPTSESLNDTPSVTATTDFFSCLAEATGPEDPIFRAATLLADAWRPALDRSYRMGYEQGYCEGFNAAEVEAAKSWAAAAKPIRDVLRMPARGER